MVASAAGDGRAGQDVATLRRRGILRGAGTARAGGSDGGSVDLAATGRDADSETASTGVHGCPESCGCGRAGLLWLDRVWVPAGRDSIDPTIHPVPRSTRLCVDNCALQPFVFFWRGESTRGIITRAFAAGPGDVVGACVQPPVAASESFRSDVGTRFWPSTRSDRDRPRSRRFADGPPIAVGHSLARKRSTNSHPVGVGRERRSVGCVVSAGGAVGA